MRFVFVMLIMSCLSSCAWWQRQSAFEPEPAQALQMVVQKVYKTFPEAPPSHVVLEYHHISIQDQNALFISEIELYLPSAWLTQSSPAELRQRAEQLFRQLNGTEPECLNVDISEQERRFVGIDQPLREVELGTACG